jgi:hypothetical protein
MTSNTQILGCSLSWLGTGTSMKSGEVKLVLNKNDSTDNTVRQDKKGY